MIIGSFLIVGSVPAEVVNALVAAFPKVAIVSAPDDVDLPSAAGGQGGEVVVLAQAGDAELHKWQHAADEEGLPRWAVANLPGFVTGNEDPSGRHDALRHLIVEALDTWQLRRENARLRGELLSVSRRIGHDLRSPLGGLMANADLLIETVPAAAAAGKSILASVEELSKLITRSSFLLKAIARPEVSGETSMQAAVAHAMQRHEALSQRLGAHISLPTHWPETTGVQGWLEVIWWNLLHNALTHAGAAPEISVGWESGGPAVRFMIRDNGPGLGEKQAHELFRPFHRLHEPSVGHGLGLVIVQRLVGLMGGTTELTSGIGSGAGFAFVLPAPDSRAEAVPR